ncbi:hypothetical protein A9Q99_08315 [Gammaproteobacteria bacterium 45_16_T64]|nr:hypothetical protein A9Q99_08315 [Gammaproteobacteria bacterium 45_16_T64]
MVEPKSTDESTGDKDKPGVPNVLNQDNVGESGLSAYERWELPSMSSEQADANNSLFVSMYRDSVEVQVVEEDDDIQPLTAEDVEAIRLAAYEEGLAQGIEAGKQKGYEEGFQHGVADLKAMLTKMSHICRALLEPIPQQDLDIEDAIKVLVSSICERVVERELQLDSSSLGGIVREALECIQPGAKRIRIHLNPDDVAFIQDQLAAMDNADFPWQLSPHPTISPGGCIVETDKSMVDARAETRLSAVIQQVYSKQSDVLGNIEDAANSAGGIDQLLSEVKQFKEGDDKIFTPDSPEGDT